MARSRSPLGRIGCHSRYAIARDRFSNDQDSTKQTVGVECCLGSNSTALWPSTSYDADRAELGVATYTANSSLWTLRLNRNSSREI